MKIALGTTLGLGFGLVLLLMVLSTTLAHFKVTNVEAVRDKTGNIRVPSVIALKDLKSDLNMSMNKARQTVLAGNEKEGFHKAKAAFDRSGSFRSSITALGGCLRKISRPEIPSDAI
jgi:hypothetical protein